MNVQPCKFSDNKRAELRHELYTDEELDVLEFQAGLVDAKFSPEAAAEILTYVSQDAGIDLTFQRWDGSYIYALDARGRLYVLIGSYQDGSYVLRGLVRRKRKDKRFGFLFNGQSSRNTSQVAYWGEQKEVEFPEFRRIMREGIAAMDSASKRRVARHTNPGNPN